MTTKALQDIIMNRIGALNREQESLTPTELEARLNDIREDIKQLNAQAIETRLGDRLLLDSLTMSAECAAYTIKLDNESNQYYLAKRLQYVDIINAGAAYFKTNSENSLFHGLTKGAVIGLNDLIDQIAAAQIDGINGKQISVKEIKNTLNKLFVDESIHEFAVNEINFTSSDIRYLLARITKDNKTTSNGVSTISRSAFRRLISRCLINKARGVDIEIDAERKWERVTIAAQKPNTQKPEQAPGAADFTGEQTEREQHKTQDEIDAEQTRIIGLQAEQKAAEQLKQEQQKAA